MTDQSLLTKAADVAKHFQISQSTLYRWRKNPRFPQPLKVGRIVYYDIAAIKAWLAVEGESDAAISAKAMEALKRTSK